MRVLSLLIAVFTFVFAYRFAFDPEAGSKARLPAQAPFHSATEEEMAHPRCINQDHVRRNNLQNFIKKYSDISRLELPSITEVAGIRFENEHPELVYRFMQLVTPPENTYFANPDLKEDTIRKAFGTPRGCNKVMCAVKRLFGQEEGPLILLLLTEYDLNLSHYVWKNASPWKAAEIRDIMKGIEAVPSHLLPLNLNQKMIHFNRGYGYKGQDSVIANASIEIFDVWNQVTQPIRQYSVYHEFSHNWALVHSNNIDVSPEWLRISGWESQVKDRSEPENWTMHPGTEQVSIYAKTNPYEDFAESVSAYRYAPQRLKQVSLMKYNFVKDVIYGGMEFTGVCPQASNVSLQYLEDFADFDANAGPDFVKESAEKCLKQNIDLVKDPTLKYSFLNCLSLNAANQVLRFKGQIHDDGIKPLALYDGIGGSRVRFQAIERAGTADLKDLLVDLLLPHMADIQDAVQKKECQYAFNSSKTETQAKDLGVKNYELYFGIQGLTTKVCTQILDAGERRVNKDVIRSKLNIYF